MTTTAESYAKMKDMPVTDWQSELKNLIDLQRSSDSGNQAVIQSIRGRLLRMSECWVTCACGNQCACIPRYMIGEPVDQKLSKLGVEFNQNITDYNFAKALDTLFLIEERAAHLLQKMNKNK